MQTVPSSPRGVALPPAANQVIGLSTATDPHIDGVFVDSGFPVSGSVNLTYRSRKEMMAAELDAFKRICTLMAACASPPHTAVRTHR